MRIFLCVMALSSILSFSSAQEISQLPDREHFYLVVLAGQSNMAGRGKIEPEDRVPHPRVWMLNQAGEWVPAVEPVHFDKSAAGVGLGRTFGIRLAESDPSIAVGLIPTACGGSSIRHWEPGKFWHQTNSYPYDDCLRRVKKGLESGKLAAILWHQGESDCHAAMAPLYEEKLRQLFQRFRQEWNAENVPILVGELERRPGDVWREKITEAQKRVVREMAANQHPAAFVSSEGLTMNPDKIHFDRASLLLFGERFWSAWQTLPSPQDSEK